MDEGFDHGDFALSGGGVMGDLDAWAGMDAAELDTLVESVFDELAPAVQVKGTGGGAGGHVVGSGAGVGDGADGGTLSSEVWSSRHSPSAALSSSARSSASSSTKRSVVEAAEDSSELGSESGSDRGMGFETASAVTQYSKPQSVDVSKRGFGDSDSDDGSERRKRKRISTRKVRGPYARRACWPCSRHKVACNNQRPCARCVRLKREHLCVDKPKKALQRGGAKLLQTRAIVENAQISRSRFSSDVDTIIEMKVPSMGMVGTARVDNGYLSCELRCSKPQHLEGLYAMFWLDGNIAYISPDLQKRSLVSISTVATEADLAAERRIGDVEAVMDVVIKASPLPTLRIVFGISTQSPVRMSINEPMRRLVGLESGKFEEAFTSNGSGDAPFSLSQMYEIVAASFVHPEDAQAYISGYCEAILKRQSSFVTKAGRIRYMAVRDGHVSSPRILFYASELVQFEYYDNGFLRSLQSTLSDLSLTREKYNSLESDKLLLSAMDALNSLAIDGSHTRSEFNEELARQIEQTQAAFGSLDVRLTTESGEAVGLD